MSLPRSASPIVAALAGRRIDAAESTSNVFPLERVETVRRKLERSFEENRIGILVCSAACGADLIGLDIACSRGMQMRVILPFSVARFRQSSVLDRPGNWGPLFDAIIASISPSDLITLPGGEASDDAYEEATKEIIKQACLLAAPEKAIAIAVWEGRARDDADATASFLSHAKKAGMRRSTIRIC